ncbi:MAG: hypothetical protein AAGK04_09850 [Planctomycetota bacterium]
MFVYGDHVEGLRRQSYRAVNATERAVYAMRPPEGEVLRAHAIWRRVRALEHALGRDDAAKLAGAWPDPEDSPNAGPLFRMDWLTSEHADWREAYLDAFRRGGWFAGETPRRYRPDVLFIPHNAYHTDEMARIAEEMRHRKHRVLFCDITEHYHDEGARARMRDLDLPHTPYAPDLLARLLPGSVFVMNDWSGPPHQAVVDARRLGIPSLALVEGVQDFEDTHLPSEQGQRRPYRHAETALLVGSFDRRFFGDHPVEITGSTRIEALAHEPRPTARARRAVINSNFTYGVHTDAQAAWVAAAAGACEDAGVDYVISRHRADEGDFSAYPISERPLYDELREAGVLVSRFSGVLLEAMALDTPVIYFNPHGERMATFQRADGAFPSPTTRAALGDAIRSLLEADGADIAARQRPFLAERVSIDRDRPSWERIAEAIERRLSFD